MSTVREVVGQITEGNVKTNEALNAIAEASQGVERCLGAIEEALSLIRGALDDSGAGALTEYAGLLESAQQHVQSSHTELEQALGDLGAGMERGETAIGNMLS